MSEIDKIDREVEWKKSVEVLKGLYPRWQTTTEQIKTWKELFGMLNPEWFRESLRLTYSKYSGENPKPNWVRELFKEVQLRHRGIPSNESDSASNARQREINERQEYEAIVNRDRENAWEEVSGWSNEERVTWATRFKKKYAILVSGRNDSSNMRTWSKTFTQQVKVFRGIQDEKV